jgi:hypothetical protein
MGATIIGAGSAQAVVSTWRCQVVSSPLVNGAAYGTSCTGNGGTGTGWLAQPGADDGWTIVYRCDYFTAFLEGPDVDVDASGCIPYT